MSTVLDATDSAAAGAPDSGMQLSTDVDRGFFGGVRRIVHSHALETDALLAMALLALSTIWLVTSAFSGVRIAFVQVALIVPLIWRRRSPTAVFVVLAGVALVQWLLDYRLVGDIALLVALYTVAVHESRLRTLLATAVLEVGAIMAATRWFPAGTVPRSIVFLTATVVAALFAGLTVRSGSEYMDWLAERAARLEIERELRNRRPVDGEDREAALADQELGGCEVDRA